MGDPECTRCVGCVGLIVGAGYNWRPLSRRRRTSQWRIGRILLRVRSCRRDYDPPASSVREVMPTDAAARPEEYSDNCTQAAGS